MITNFASLPSLAFYTCPLHSTIRVPFPTALLGWCFGEEYAAEQFSRQFRPTDIRVQRATSYLSALTFPYILEAALAVRTAAMACTHQLVSRTTVWLVSNGTMAALIGTVAAHTVITSLTLGLFITICCGQLKLNYKIAKWLVNDAPTKEYWQNLFLWTRSYVGFANAGHFNAVDDKQLKYININMLKCLPISELKHVDGRIINALPEHDKTEINSLLLTPAAWERVERLNTRAENDEDISINELNSLSAREMRELNFSVLLQIEQQGNDLERLSHQVLNNLSPITLAELPISILLNLSPTTLQNLQPHVLNGSSFDLEQYLPERIKQHLSVIPIRWDRREILDIETPNIANNVREHRRLYWVQNDGNYREAPPVEGQYRGFERDNGLDAAVNGIMALVRL